MKKLVFMIVFGVFVMGTASVQILQKPLPGTRQTGTIKNAPVPAPPPVAQAPPATTNKSTGVVAQNTPTYTLTAVRVNIRTGTDNKEYPSNVKATLGVNKSGGMEYAYFVQENLKNEMRSNTNTEFGLEKYMNNTMKGITLEALQASGIRLNINYKANFQLDAWKIEGIIVTLEFRDQSGNPHPTLAQKTINFSNANGFLNGYAGTTTMFCTSDGYFNPLSANIQ